MKLGTSTFSSGHISLHYIHTSCAFSQCSFKYWYFTR